VFPHRLFSSTDSTVETSGSSERLEHRESYVRGTVVAAAVVGCIHALIGTKELAMVQFSIAYVALGCAILLILVGIFAVRHPYAQRLLSDSQRALLLGGIGGMLLFLIFLVVWTW
jgi:hypothetical protein